MFEGDFESDWDETADYLKEAYGIDWTLGQKEGSGKNYEIEKIEAKIEHDENNNEKKNAKFWKYLPYDKRNLQLSGEPNYDFAMDLYSLKCGEGLHFKKGTINY